MELAWNTQKNQMSDVKGKEMEQERAGKIKNEDIDRSRTKHNYDLVPSDKNLYQRVKNRVDDLKKEGSRVQKNSVVMYSNILTVPEEQAKKWGDEKTAAYFKACKDFFCDEFGKENVVSAKVHQDETTPHMHLHFVPVNKENGRLQARTAMNRAKVNHIHDALPKFLQERGFDVYRGSGKTKDKNIEDVHEYKEVQKKVAEKNQELADLLQALPENKESVPFLKKETETETVKKGFLQKETVEKETGNVVLSAEQYEDLTEKLHAAVAIKNDYERLKNTDLVQSLEKAKRIAHDGLTLAKGYEDENKKLKQENKELSHQVNHLNGRLADLRHEVRLIYQSAKEFVKERTKGTEAFRSVFKGLVDKVKEKVSRRDEKLQKEPKMSEFELAHVHELRKQRDQGMER